MGVSFKVSKTGTRFRPKPVQSDASVLVAGGDDDDEDDDEDKNPVCVEESPSTSAPKLLAEANRVDEVIDGISDIEVSFILNLFPDGYSIGKPAESEVGQQNTLQEVPKFLHPYDRASDSLFLAIESGQFPGEILDDIPCKLVNGTLLCEVRDYRKSFSESGLNVPSADHSPTINKIRLKMSLENVVKDIPLISDDAWTYGDLMEVESRILRALQPQLCLDPAPKLDRLCDSSVSFKLNLGLGSMRKKRLRQMQEITVISNNKIHGKKVCIDRVPETSRLGESGSRILQQLPNNENLDNQTAGLSNMFALRQKGFGPEVSIPASPLLSQQLKYQMGIGNTRSVQDHVSGAVVNAPGASPSGQDEVAYPDNMNSSAAFHVKRDALDGHSSPSSGMSKRARLMTVGPDGCQQQQVGPNIDGFHGPESQWKNALLQQHSIARGIQCANTGMQKYSHQMFEGALNQDGRPMPFTMGQQGISYNLKEEPVDAERLDKMELNRNRNDMRAAEAEMNNMDSQQPQLQQRLPQQFVRSGFSQIPWNNFGQPLENNSRKEDQFQKRKLVSPRVSAGGLPQSPLSSKSGELSSGSIGPQYGAVAATAALGSAQKEKSTITSVPAVGGTSVTSSGNDSMQRQQQAQMAAKRRSNSLPKTPAMSGVGSPASVSNMSIPLNASSSPVGTQPLADQIMLERLSKIELVTMRFQLNCKKNKVDEYPARKINAYPSQQLLHHLSSDVSGESYKDETCKMPLSKSLVGGNMNTCKMRVLNFVQTERILQGNGVQIVPKLRTIMIMSEKPNDGTVAMHYGEIDDADYLAAEDYLPTLPNTHSADLLAAQLCTLMIREGYHVEDRVQPKPIRMNRSPSNQSGHPGVAPNNVVGEMQQYSEAVSGQQSKEVVKPADGCNISQNLPSTRMLPPGNTQSLQISQGLVPGVSMPSRSQQPDPQPSLQQHQNQHSLLQPQHSQFQRSPLMLAANPLSPLNMMGQNPNMQLGSHMANKPSPLQLQLLQQQQQQQQMQPQQSPMQRKMMMGLGTVGIGNIGNNMVGLGSLGNVMGMDGGRGMGGTGISAPMGQISGMGNVVGQNPMNLSQASSIGNVLTQQYHSGLNPAQAALMATKLRMAPNRTNMLGGQQSSIGGMSGPRQIQPGSTGLSMLGPTLNRTNMNLLQRSAMGPMGPPKLMAGMNPYMNQQQQQQLQLQQQQQQDTASPLQAIVSSQQVGSPSTMGIPQQLSQQQQTSPQHISQRTPMSPQLSAGTVNPMSAGNPEACPASPLGSVSSITNSPMELQGVNKSSSVSNA